MTAEQPELAARNRHLLALQQAGYESKSFIHWLTLSPGHPGLPNTQCVNHVSGIVCKLSLDYDISLVRAWEQNMKEPVKAG